MKKPSDEHTGGYGIGDLLGLGSQSVRKNYYPALQQRIEELEQERNRYKWLFENALHGIFQANLRGGFLACNPAMARICGYHSPEQLVTRVIRLREQLFCRSADFDAIRQALLDNGSVSARETRFLRAEGRPVHVAVTLLRRPDLGPEVVEAFVADITERVQARQKLEQLNQELEQRVEARTRALRSANADLRHQIEERERVERELMVAIEAAKAANRSKDKYLAAASHDLLQPLNAARLMISALQDSDLPAPERRMVHQVHRALEGAEELLADLLDIARLDQRTMTPDLAPTDVTALLEGLADEFEAVAEHAGLRFRRRLVPAVVHTDARMLTRIVRNLLSNAFRYTRAGGVLLALRRCRDELCIEVWDSGVGIEADQLQDIFTEFRQLLPQGTGGRQGVGLGLAIVERMARMLGYPVEVASRPGGHLHRVPQHPRHALDDGQPQTDALAAAGALGQQLTEFGEDVLQLVRLDADTGVPYLDAQLVPAPAQGQQYSAGPGVPEGIAEQVANDPGQHARIGMHHRRDQPAPEPEARVFGHRLELVRQSLQQGRDIGRCQVRGHGPLVQAGNVEQVRQQFLRPFQGPVHLVHHAPFRCRQVAVLECGDHQARRIQRLQQIVAGGGQVLVLAAIGRLGGLDRHHQFPFHPFPLLDLVTQVGVGTAQRPGPRLDPLFQLLIQLLQLLPSLHPFGDVGHERLHHLRPQIRAPQQGHRHVHRATLGSQEAGLPGAHTAVVQ